MRRPVTGSGRDCRWCLTLRRGVVVVATDGRMRHPGADSGPDDVCGVVAPDHLVAIGSDGHTEPGAVWAAPTHPPQVGVGDLVPPVTRPGLENAMLGSAGPPYPSPGRTSDVGQEQFVMPGLGVRFGHDVRQHSGNRDV